MINFITTLIYLMSLGYSSEDCSKFLQLDSTVENLIQLNEKINACSPQYQKDYLKLFPISEPSESRDVLGQAISGTKFELDTLDQVLGINRKDEQLIKNGKPFYHNTPEEWAAMAKNCKSASCLLTKLFSNEESAYRVLSIAKKTGYVISLGSVYIFSSPEKKKWNLEEIKQVEKALNLLPAEMYNMKSLKTFKKSDPKKDTCGHAAAYYSRSETVIAFCPGGWDFSTILHEIGHAHDHNTVDSDHSDCFSNKSGFNDISGWKPGPITVKDDDAYKSETYSDSSSFISDYAKTNSLEDYAETFEKYISNPRELMAVSPKKYAIMKEKVFKGKEYITPELHLDLEKIFGIEELITNIIPQCLAEMDFIRFAKNSKASFWIGNRCSEEVNAAVQTKFNNLSVAERCKLENIEDIKSYANLRVSKSIESTISSLLPSPRGDERFKSAYKKDCFSKKDLTAECYFNVLSKLSPKALSRWNNNKTSQAQILENFKRIAAKNETKNGLQSPMFEMFGSEIKVPWSKARIYKECIEGVDEISFPHLLGKEPKKEPNGPPPPPPPFDYNKEYALLGRKTFPLIKFSAFCDKSLKDRSKKFGYVLDENDTFEEIFLEKNIGQKSEAYTKKRFSDFDNAVLKKVADKSKECSLLGDQALECQKQSLKESILKWASDAGFDPAEFIGEKFLNELNSKFRW